MLFIPVVALLSPAWAMRNLGSHETALGIEDQDKRDPLLGRWKQMVQDNLCVVSHRVAQEVMTCDDITACLKN